MKLRSAVYIIIVGYQDGDLGEVKHIEGVYAKEDVAKAVYKEYKIKGYNVELQKYKVRF